MNFPEIGLCHAPKTEMLGKILDEFSRNFTIRRKLMRNPYRSSKSKFGNVFLNQVEAGSIRVLIAFWLVVNFVNL